MIVTPLQFLGFFAGFVSAIVVAFFLLTYFVLRSEWLKWSGAFGINYHRREAKTGPAMHRVAFSSSWLLSFDTLVRAVPQSGGMVFSTRIPFLKPFVIPWNQVRVSAHQDPFISVLVDGNGEGEIHCLGPLAMRNVIVNYTA
ncbi:MAG: hypothetical protein R3F11_01055 [Verrucomicrobiales bacterium]